MRNYLKRYILFCKYFLEYLNLIFLFFGLSFLNAQVDWKETVSSLLSSKKYEEAYSFIQHNLDTLPDYERPAATSLLAFTAGRANKKQQECRRLAEFFEIYGGFSGGYEFLDEQTFYDLRKYLFFWNNKYPLILEISLIEKKTESKTSPPSDVVVYLEISNPAYYKIFHQNKIIKAGLFQKGTNTFSLKLNNFFREQDIHEYFLELKSEELIVTKKFLLKIDINSSLAVNDELEFPEKTIEQNISFFIDDKLIVSSRKVHTSVKPLSIELPPSDGLYRPFGPVKEEEPWMNSFSIDEAVSGISGLLNKLTRKKDKDDYQLRKGKMISFNFNRLNQKGLIENIQVALTLNLSGFSARFNSGTKSISN